MSKIKDGGPAFPHDGQVDYTGGMRLRDYFAAKAMQSLIAGEYQFFKNLAIDAYKMADAMLEVRENAMQTPVAWWSGEPDTYILCNVEYQRHKDNENFDAIRHLKPLYAMRERGE